MKICKLGHEREDSGMVCLVCKRAAKKAWAANNKARVSEYNKQYAKENSEAIATRMKNTRVEYYKKNAETLKAESAAWYKENKIKALAAAKEYRTKNAVAINDRRADYRERTKSDQQARNKKWRQENPDKKLAAHRRRELAKKKRKPQWYNHQDCVAIYAEARKQNLVVDHIIPLQGELVSGLHWHHNMQLLTISENSRKGNKFDPGTYVHELPFY